MKIFLKDGARKAEAVLEKPDLSKTLQEAEIGQLARALIARSAALTCRRPEKLKNDPGSDYRAGTGRGAGGANPTEHMAGSDERGCLSLRLMHGLVRAILEHIDRHFASLTEISVREDSPSAFRGERPRSSAASFPTCMQSTCRRR